MPKPLRFLAFFVFCHAFCESTEASPIDLIRSVLRNCFSGLAKLAPIDEPVVTSRPVREPRERPARKPDPIREIKAPDIQSLIEIWKANLNSIVNERLSNFKTELGKDITDEEARIILSEAYEKILNYVLEIRLNRIPATNIQLKHLNILLGRTILAETPTLGVLRGTLGFNRQNSTRVDLTNFEVPGKTQAIYVLSSLAKNLKAASSLGYPTNINQVANLAVEFIHIQPFVVFQRTMSRIFLDFALMMSFFPPALDAEGVDYIDRTLSLPVLTNDDLAETLAKSLANAKDKEL